MYIDRYFICSYDPFSRFQLGHILHIFDFAKMEGLELTIWPNRHSQKYANFPFCLSHFWPLQAKCCIYINWLAVLPAWSWSFGGPEHNVPRAWARANWEFRYKHIDSGGLSGTITSARNSPHSLSAAQLCAACQAICFGVVELPQLGALAGSSTLPVPPPQLWGTFRNKSYVLLECICSRWRQYNRGLKSYSSHSWRILDVWR